METIKKRHGGKRPGVGPNPSIDYAVLFQENPDGSAMIRLSLQSLAYFQAQARAQGLTTRACIEQMEAQARIYGEK